MAHLQTTMKAIEHSEAAELAARAEKEIDSIASDIASGSVDDPVEPAQPVWRDGDPDVGDWVIYQPRRGMIRRGRNRVAALVVHRHEHARLLDLAIFYEANDTLDDQRVPEAVGEERGWLVKAPRMNVTVNRAPVEFAELRQGITDLRALVLGGFEVPATSVCDCLYLLDERVDKLERAAAKPKRKRGRPAKAKVMPAPVEPKAE